MNEILEKIKKLLRMKRGGTTAEVETALAMAEALARKHGIDIASVNPDEATEERRISHDDAVRAGRIQWEQKYAMLVCQQFFNVTTLLRAVGWRQMRVTFIGTRSDIQIAFYVFAFLVSHFRRSWNRSSGRARNRRAFLDGMYYGLCAKLDSERQRGPQENAAAVLVIRAGVAKRREYLATNFGPLKDQSCDPGGNAEKSKLLGYIEGQKTNIRPAVAAPETQASFLLQ